VPGGIEAAGVDWGTEDFSVQFTSRPLFEKDRSMLEWAIIFLVIALVAGALGFTGIARGAATIAKVIFFIFLAIFVVMLILAILGISLIA
jgi:uncharacterized membrane protein YtjA (UPF0391 family)